MLKTIFIVLISILLSSCFSNGYLVKINDGLETTEIDKIPIPLFIQYEYKF